MLNFDKIMKIVFFKHQRLGWLNQKKNNPNFNKPIIVGTRSLLKLERVYNY